MNRWLVPLLMMGFLLSLMGIKNPSIAQGRREEVDLSKSPCSHCLWLIPTGQSNRLGNPLYLLQVYYQKQLIYSFETVSGRHYTQDRNRHRAGTEAPLPDGQYSINRYSVPGTIAEVGGRFIEISPRFRTGRSALGIHYDPSYNKSNGEDGTSGCIGLTNRRDFEQLRRFIEVYPPQFLLVDIQ
ncbi:conserved hypothetical protein [Rippkaea orientalis PCC 8801]|uniref:L,D-TPase catalytic domain-containing protein n=1 Tax=Rippkaea orientalis (strain PCC 8801 / RF-1) TaxID=41431 RepID=B7K5T2_RIPO1|nr:L,D-transpeptidase [Rippkaea orientalis]ACK67985.1 conserved hypothetical protein [Rippkaea orientalis PCC 8801]